MLSTQEAILNLFLNATKLNTEKKDQNQENQDCIRNQSAV